MKFRHIRLSWKWYFVWLLVFYIILPIKPMPVAGWVVSYGIAGMLNLFLYYPLDFFVAPLIPFAIVKLLLFAYNSILIGFTGDDHKSI